MRSLFAAWVLLFSTGSAYAEWYPPPSVIEAQKAWTLCLAMSMQAQRPRFADANEAAEAAFRACQTEENGLLATLVGDAHLTPPQASTLVAMLRPKMKKSMLEIK